MRAKHPLALSIGAIAVIVVACATSNAQPLTKLTFALDWVIGGQHAPFFYTLKKGYFKDEGLDVQLVPGSGPATVQQIAAGTYDMGFADVTFLIEFKGNNSKQFDVKEVYMVHNDNPNSFLTLKKYHISSLADLKGKRIAASTFSGQKKAWPILVKRKHLPPDYITWVDYAPTLGFQAVVRGKVDAAAGYPNQAGLMAAAGAKMNDIKIIPFSSLGLDMYGDGIVANGKFIKEHPDIVKKFVLAFNRGLRESVVRPKAAVQTVLDTDPTLQPDAAMAQFTLIIPSMVTPEVRKNGFGPMDIGKLKRQIDDMDDAYHLKTKPSVADVYDPSFLPPADQRRVLSN
jgi:NitT/TauT family transport system substrate-binding protein